MITPDPVLTEAFVSAFRAAREARQYTSVLCALLARKLQTNEHAAQSIVRFIELSVVCGLLHKAVGPWVEADGVDWAGSGCCGDRQRNI